MELIKPYTNKVNERFKNTDAVTLIVGTAVVTVVVVRGSVCVKAFLKQCRKKGVVAAVVEGVSVFFVNIAKAVPGGASIIEAENKKLVTQLEKMLIKETDDEKITRLPAQGRSADDIMAVLNKWKQREESIWQSGKVSGCVYHGENETSELIKKAIGTFILSNPLHPDVFPATRKMEAEIVAMAVNMFNGGEGACGTTTSGGTESILLAVKGCRDYARTKRGITQPDMVVPVSAHAAFIKAAHYFGIEVHRIPVDPVTFRADVKQMKAAVTSNTIIMVGSAPQFAQGVIDPIEELSTFAHSKGIPFHVDCCLGSFLMPFMEEAGYSVPKFDFRLPGVTSISVDSHKFGFAPKGNSIILWANTDLRRAQYFVDSDWTGGIYASPTLAGSRPGALSVGCWATMIHMGHEGYLKSCKAIVGSAREFQAEVEKIKELKVLGKPDVAVVCFTTVDSNLSIRAIGDAMSSRGWNLNSLQYPAALHICCTTPSIGRAADFGKDLVASVQEVAKDPKKYKDGVGAIYGMAESIPDRSLVSGMAAAFIDVMFKA